MGGSLRAGLGRLALSVGVFIAAGLYVGVIVYTHTQPDGPHSLDMYIKSHDWEQYRSEGTPGHAAPTEQPAGDGR